MPNYCLQSDSSDKVWEILYFVKQFLYYPHFTYIKLY